jgi:aminoglycoside/choline kinase family phosphotransferase
MEFSVVEKTTKTDQRLDQADAWLQGLGVEIQSDFLDVAGDASFRRYFRVQVDGVSRVLMDAPPPGENVDPFIDVAKRLRTAGLHAPEIIHADRQNGYLLLEDLGDDLYREILDTDSVDQLFPDLFRILKTMALEVDSRDLHGLSDAMLRFEMNLLPNWYLDHHRKTMSREMFNTHWDAFCDLIIDSALSQPQCFVHRDFHSCNLLRVSASEIGIIDFQDAVIGPVSYDLISLIWDRYIRWPRAGIENWIEQFRVELGLDIEPELWLRYCDLMGLQRNIKIVGIFARLHYRDGKKGYLEMIPRFYAYITETLKRYPEFKQILSILEQTECVP